MSLALATMVGCQNENEILNVQEVSNPTFTASFENNGSRTALQGENNNVVWLEGDKLSVFAGKAVNKPYILDEGKNTNYGTFIPEGGVSAGTSTGTSSVSTLSANVAYYPYSQDVTVSESTTGSFTFSASVPAEQTFSQSGTFGNGASPMVAVTASKLDDELMFKNVGGIFRLQLKDDASVSTPTTITKIVFSAEGNNLAGKYQVTTTHNSTDQTLNVTEGSSTITLDCGDGVPLSSTEPTNFVVAMLPVSNVQGGLTITIYDAGGTKMSFVHKDENVETFSLARSGAKSTEEKTYATTGTAITTEANLKSALQEATSSNTPANIVVEDDITLDEPLSIESTTNVNLDLGGNTLVLGEAVTRSLSEYGIENKGTLKFSNGSIEYTGSKAIINRGVLEFENVDLTTSYIAVSNVGVWESNMTVQTYKGTEAEVKFTMNGGSITSTADDKSTNVYAIMAVDYSLIDIKNAVIKGTKTAGGLHLNCAEAKLEGVTITPGTEGTAHQVCLIPGVLTYTNTDINNHRYYYGDSKGKYGYAEVNGVYYGDVNQVIATDETSLVNAFSNLENGATVKLYNDISVTNQLAYNKASKSLVLDLNSKTLTLGATYGLVNKAGKLTIKNGKITGNCSYASLCNWAGENAIETILENVEVTASYIGMYSKGVWGDNMTVQTYKGTEAEVKFTMNGGSITSTADDKSTNVYAIMAVDYSLIDIKNAVIKGTKTAGGLHLNCAEAKLEGVTITPGTEGTAHQVCLIPGVLTYTNTDINNHRYYYGDSKGKYGYAEVNGTLYGEVNQVVNSGE